MDACKIFASQKLFGDDTPDRCLILAADPGRERPYTSRDIRCRQPEAYA
jgi:hypothetical protein